MNKPLVFNYKDYQDLREAYKKLLADNQRLLIDNRRLRKNVADLETKLLDNLDAITWYNCLAEEITTWKELRNDNGIIPCPLNHVRNAYEGQLQFVWMLCVLMFGDYGTSPRYGWINWENKDVFDAFIDDITKTEREQ